MQLRTLAIAIAAALAAGCVSNESKPEAAGTTAPATSTASPPPAAAPAPLAAKPECPVETGSKKKTAKTKTSKKKGDPAPADCEPAKAKTTNGQSQTADPTPAPAPATKEDAKPAEAGKPRIVKSRDGTFEGEVYGNPPASSKWAKLQIGMEQPEVERILGGSSNDVRTMPTGKAFIPFYYGTDRYRYEVVYHGQGSVSYTGGSWGGGRGVLMMINYDPKMQ